MTQSFDVEVAAGSLRSTEAAAVRFPHRWTEAGVTVTADFTGGHLLHLAAAGCILNDIYREAATLELTVDGVRVVARGGFDSDTWASTGIVYEVELDSPEEPADLVGLLRTVDAVAEIPRALRAGAHVERG